MGAHLSFIFNRRGFSKPPPTTASRCRLTGGQPTGFECPRQTRRRRSRRVQAVCRPRSPDVLHILYTQRARRNDGRLARSSSRGSLPLMARISGPTREALAPLLLTEALGEASIRGSGRGARQAGRAHGANCLPRLIQMKALVL